MDLMTYDSIPNVEQNVINKSYIDTNLEISLPTGAYEIDDINKFIIKELTAQFKLESNNNTPNIHQYSLTIRKNVI